MKTLIVGAGAMGCLFGGKLKKEGMDVTLYNRENVHVQKIQDNGLKIIEKDGSITKVDIPMITDATKLEDHYDLVIVLVKSFATEDVISKVLHTINPETVVLTLQNGIGNIEVLQKYVPNSQLTAGGTNTGAGIVEPGTIAHRAWGKTFIGALNSEQTPGSLDEIAFTLTKCGLMTEVKQDIQSIIWGKLMVNIAFNGLTAVTRLKNGAVVSSDEGKDVIRKLIEEATQVAHAHGVPLLYNHPADECIRLGMEEISKNKSSMLTDILNKRKTEIESINFAIVNLGKKYGIPTPYNEMMTNLVKVIEHNYSELVTII